MEESDIYAYTDGICYYTVWIKHNPDEDDAMAQDKYGVVRNYWYDLIIRSISKVGSNKPQYDGDPEDPDDAEEVSIQVKTQIKRWVLVKQEVDL